ncbi:MAG: hypothetical protein HYZ17_07235 [Betaproteobacteria bacterium]|nr:hypothetical protein [Betaproteobacteria bacterium]
MVQYSRFDALAAFLNRPVGSEGPQSWKLALACFGIALLLCGLGFLALTLPFPWTSDQAVRHWGAAEMTLSRGVGGRTESGLIVRDTDATGIAIISLAPPPFRAQGYRQVTWTVEGSGPDVSAALLWRNDYKPAAMHTTQMQPLGQDRFRAWVADDRDWIGKVAGLALVIKGKPARPLRITAIEVSPRTAGEAIREHVHAWFKFEPWHGSSINSIDARAPALPLPPFAGAVVLCGVLCYAVLAWFMRWRRQFTVYFGIFGLAWLMVDGRWQVSLIEQTRLSAASFANKSLDEKHLAAEDAPVYAFAARAREVLPKEPARLIVTAEDGALRGRLAYYLLPHRAFYETRGGAMPHPSALKSGDFVVALFRRNFQFNPSENLLKWDDYAPIAAELLLLDQGNAVFRIK